MKGPETEGMLRYRKLTAVWMAARESAGGSLSQEDEAYHAARVDRVWRSLSEREQDALEAGLPMSAPAMKDPERPGLLASSASFTAAAVRFVIGLGAALWKDWRAYRREQARAKVVAETPAIIRGCPRCKEIAFTPGQVTCTKCGAFL